MPQLGTKSKTRLVGVHPDLVRVVALAITLSAQDFTVHEGLRSMAKQLEYKRTGASQTLASRHLKGSDGYGHAVDLYAWVNGDVRFEWALYWPIADAMRQAAQRLGIPVRWGGGWFELNGCSSLASIKAQTARYTASRKAMGKSAFLDGPHFELAKSARYP